MKAKAAIPYFFSVFAISFLQMGLFIFFQRWLSFSFSGNELLWRSVLLQVLLFSPYILVVSGASYYSSRFPKNKVMANTALWMTVVLSLIAWSFSLGFVWVSYSLVFLFSIFAAIESPAKLAIQKELFGEDLIALSNAYQSAFSILGVVAVSYFTMALSPSESSFFAYDLLPWIFVLLGVFATISAYNIPLKQVTSRKVQWRSGSRIVKATWSNSFLRFCIIGLAIYWGLAQVFVLLSQGFSAVHFSNMLRNTLVFSAIGLIFGFFAAARASRNFIETGLIPTSALVTALTMFLAAFVTNEVLQALLYGVVGFNAGLFFVLVKSLLLLSTKPATAGRIMAVANMIQMLFLFAFLILQFLALSLVPVSLEYFFIPLALISFIGFIYLLYQAPQALLRAMLRAFFVFRYKLKPIGVKNIPKTGPVLLVGSHYSFIDWAVLQMASPRPLVIASNRSRYDFWFLSPLKKRLGIIFIDRRNPSSAMEEIKEALLENKAVVIFPEGEVSKSPFISRFSIDYTSAIQGTHAQIIPFYIYGLWGSAYSHDSQALMLPNKTARLVSVGFAPQLEASVSENQIREAIRDLSVRVWEQSIRHYKSIPDLVLRAIQKKRFNVAVYSVLGEHSSGYDFVAKTLYMIKKTQRETGSQSKIGFMFPPGLEGYSTFISIVARAKISVNLNYSHAAEIVYSCIQKLELKTVMTTRFFYDKLCQKDAKFKNLSLDVRLIFVDDLLQDRSFISKVYYYSLAVFSPAFLLQQAYLKKQKLKNTATILFSSGSEGVPKGIMLSQHNILSNILQVDSVVRLRESDVVLSQVPMFHSFGLTANILLSLINGTPSIPCPDTTDIKTVARVCAEFKATVFMATPTFVRAFNLSRWVHPMCLEHVRIVLSGAEKVRPELREAFKIKFGKEIFEAYGCTETSPLATLNGANVLLDDFLTMEKCNQYGTVGMPIPGTQIKIVDPDSHQELELEEEGMVLVAGPQVMQGYYNEPEKTKEAVIEMNSHRWYRTGDKGFINRDGFLTIVDRYSRFAKLGGEAVSLGAVDLRIQETKILDGAEFVSVAVPDTAKGEVIVVLYSGDLDPYQVSLALKKSGMPPLMIPRKAIQLKEIPKLGTGKWDFKNIKKEAMKRI